MNHEWLTSLDAAGRRNFHQYCEERMTSLTDDMKTAVLADDMPKARSAAARIEEVQEFQRLVRTVERGR